MNDVAISGMMLMCNSDTHVIQKKPLFALKSGLAVSIEEAAKEGKF